MVEDSLCSKTHQILLEMLLIYRILISSYFISKDSKLASIRFNGRLNIGGFCNTLRFNVNPFVNFNKSFIMVDQLFRIKPTSHLYHWIFTPFTGRLMLSHSFSLLAVLSTCKDFNTLSLFLNGVIDNTLLAL